MNKFDAFIIFWVLSGIVVRLIKRKISKNERKKEEAKEQALAGTSKINRSLSEASAQGLEEAVETLSRIGLKVVQDDDGRVVLRIPEYFWETCVSSQLNAESLLTVVRGFEKVVLRADGTGWIKAYEEIQRILLDLAKTKPNKALEVAMYIGVKGGVKTTEMIF